MPLLCLRSEVLNDVYQKLQKHNAVCGVHFSVNVAVAGTPLLVVPCHCTGSHLIQQHGISHIDSTVQINICLLYTSDAADEL